MAKQQTAISNVSKGGKILRALLGLILVVGLMPGLASLTPSTAYADAAPTVQVTITDKNGDTMTVATWTYDSDSETYIDDATGEELTIVSDYSEEEGGCIAYTGINKKPDPRCVAVTVKGIEYDDLYQYVGDLIKSDGGAEILRSDDVTLGFSSTVGSKPGITSTYNNYWGKTRYSYSAWFDAEEAPGATVAEEYQSSGVEVPSGLAIKGYHATKADCVDLTFDEAVADLVGKADTVKSLRAMQGQVEGGDSADINMGQWSTYNVSSIVFTIPEKTFDELGIYNWDSTTWAGGLDFSWYDENDVQASYTLSTPAQWEALAWICSEELSDLADYTTTTAGNVTAIRGTIPSAQNTFAGVQFYLDNDIDMGGVCSEEGTWSGQNYYPIGSEGTNDLSTDNFWGLFCGSFDGQGHVVKNVYCARNSTTSGSKGSSSVALFGRVGAADNTTYPEVDITIENIAVTGYISGYRSCGGVVGKTLHVAAGHSVKVENCVNFATVKTAGGAKGTGGVVGALWNGAIVDNCVNFGTVTGGYRTANVAGVSGAAEGATSNSYNVGTVSNTATAANCGAVALNQSPANVTNCYALENSCPGYTTSIVNGNTLVSGGWMTAANMQAERFAGILNIDNAGAWAMAASTDSIAAVMSDAGVAGYPVPAAFSTNDPVEAVPTTAVATEASNLQVDGTFVVTISVKGTVAESPLAAIQGTIDYDTTALELTGVAANEATDGTVDYDLTSGTFSITGNTVDTAEGLAIIDATFKCTAASAGASVNVKDVTVTASGQATSEIDAVIGKAISLPIYYQYTKGDVNNNSKINVIDAQVALDMANKVYGTDYALLLTQLSTAGTTWDKATVTKAADVNENGSVTSDDARAIQHYWHTQSW